MNVLSCGCGEVLISSTNVTKVTRIYAKIACLSCGMEVLPALPAADRGRK